MTFRSFVVKGLGRLPGVRQISGGTFYKDNNDKSQRQTNVY